MHGTKHFSIVIGAMFGAMLAGIIFVQWELEGGHFWKHNETIKQVGTFFVMLTNQAIEARPHLTTKSVKGDGNCLFRSLGYQIGDEDNFEAIRLTIVSTVLDNPDEYVGFFPGGHPELQEWGSTMLAGAWGDGICLRSVPRALNVTVAVFRKATDQPPTVFVPPDATPSTLSPPIYLELDETYAAAEHYSPLVFEDETQVLAPPKRQRRKTKRKRHTDVVIASGSQVAGPEEPAEKPAKKFRGSTEESLPEAAMPEEPAEESLPLLDDTLPVLSPQKEPANKSNELRSNRSSPSLSPDRKPATRSNELAGDSLPVLKHRRKKHKTMKEKRNKRKENASAVYVPELVEPRESDMYVQTGARPVEDGATCLKCGLWVTRSNVRLTGKQKQCWICKVCHSRYSALCRGYEKWPPARFKLLSPEQQQGFWKEVGTKSGIKKMKELVDETITIGKVDQFGNKSSGKYLPLSVYRQQGYNTKRIKRNCKDVKYDAILGNLYRLQIDESFELNMEEFRREQVTGANNHPAIQSQAAATGRVARAPSSKVADAEAVRVAKAVAIQQAREESANKKVATKYLGKFVQLSFNLHSTLNNKSVKKLTEDSKKELVDQKADVQAMVKRLQTAMCGKPLVGGADECQHLFAKASDANNRLLSYASMQALVV